MDRLLIVEDNEMNRNMLTRRLERKGYEIDTAVDGAKGVEKAKDENPALNLMDLSLTNVNGWEVTRMIKGSRETKHIPVTALTSHAMSGNREKAL